MKKLLLTSVLALLVAAVGSVGAQNKPEEYLGLPGDNLNLYAVMNLFQESETIEDFEKSLNEENSRINNLDLNGDNYVDYIAVNDYVDGDVHTIVLQTALSPNEKQDIAVFTVERFNDGSVRIQLIGDEALYGRNYIVEPIYAETPNPGYRGRRVNRNAGITYYEVAAWPMIRFIYQPHYVVWHSSWYWGYYPSYWHSWTPYYYDYYYGYHRNWYPVYYQHYRHWNEPRYSGYHSYYHSHVRSYSPTVIVNINKGHYKSTYSHPESRREGEALYSRDRANRSSNLNTTRRSTEVRSDRTGRGNGNVRSTESTRRSPATVTNRSNTRSTGNGERNATMKENTNRSSGATRKSDQNRTQRKTSTPTERKTNDNGQVTRYENQSGTNHQVERSTAVRRNNNAGSTSNDRTYSQSSTRTVSRSEPQKRVERTSATRQSGVKSSGQGNTRVSTSTRKSNEKSKSDKESTTRRK